MSFLARGGLGLGVPIVSFGYGYAGTRLPPDLAVVACFAGDTGSPDIIEALLSEVAFDGALREDAMLSSSIPTAGFDGQVLEGPAYWANKVERLPLVVLEGDVQGATLAGELAQAEAQGEIAGQVVLDGAVEEGAALDGSLRDSPSLEGEVVTHCAKRS